MSTIDEELFELCKKVYEKSPLWVGTTQFFRAGDVYNEGEYEDYGMSYNFTEHTDDVPLYTSDYLLEKFPDIDLTISRWNVGWRAYAVVTTESNSMDYGCNGDTPLKALLKLTLALYESGELVKGGSDDHS